MAGNENSGRPRLNIADHIESGNYRPSRHGLIPDSAEGEPQRPRSLTGEARKQWDRIVPDLVWRGLAKAIDAAALEQLCQLWALAAAVLKLLKKTPADSSLAATYRGYVREYNAIGRRFGLACADRQKLRAPPAASGPKGVASRKRA